MPSKRVRQRLTRILCLVAALLVCYECLTVFTLGPDASYSTATGPSASTTRTLQRRKTSESWKGLRVGIVEFAAYHEEVWGAVLHSFRHLGANVTLFRPAYRFSFDEIFDASDMGPMLDPFIKLPKPLANDELDVIVIASGDKYWVDAKMRATLDAAKNTSVVLFIHHSQALEVERHSLQDVAAENRLTLVGLAGHTTDMITSTIANWSVEDTQIGWDRTLVQTFVPVFPIDTTAPKQKITRGDQLRPSRVAIQGRIEYKRRSYEQIFTELHQAVIDDPMLWGYDIGSPGEAFKARTTDSVPPFTLHLIGEHVGGVTWPTELDNIVHVHSGLHYKGYYDVLSSMDLLMPAFAGPEYMIERASSSMTAAVMAKVPMLLTPQHVRSYTFLEPPAIKLHPGGMSAISAIKLLRSGRDPWTSDLVSITKGGPSRDHDPVMPGSSDTAVDWARYHQTLYDANDRVWSAIADRFAFKAGRSMDTVSKSKG